MFALGEGVLLIGMSIILIITLSSSDDKRRDIVNYRGIINNLKIEKEFIERELEIVKKDKDELYKHFMSEVKQS